MVTHGPRLNERIWHISAEIPRPNKGTTAAVEQRGSRLTLLFLEKGEAFLLFNKLDYFDHWSRACGGELSIYQREEPKKDRITESTLAPKSFG
jgi:hypothetical protein